MSFTSIKIEGQDVGLYFGYPCLRWFSEQSQEYKDCWDASGFNDLGVAELLLSAYKNDCRINRAKPIIEFRHFYQWVEKNIKGGVRSAELEEVIKVFNESQPVIDLAKQQEEKKSQMQESGTQENTSTQSSESLTENSE